MTHTATPISVQLYSLRDEAAADFEAVLNRLGEIGFAGVELANFHGLTPARFAELLSAADLRLSSAHVVDATPDALNASLDDLQSIGCDTVALAFLPPAAFVDADAVSRSAELINQAQTVAAQRSVALAYHNHWWEFGTVIDGRSAWDLLFEQLEPGVLAELDVYWATVGGADPVTVMEALGSRLRLVHVKDGPADDPQNAMVAVGSGTLDVPRILHAASAAAWHVVELDRCETDMMGAIADSYAFLTGNGLSAGRS